MLATAHTFVLEGAVGHLIEVQVDISPGVVGATIVGRPDAALLEARDRVRMAVTHDSPPWPTTKRVTILLAPADLPKSGTHFDLAIAVGIKAANEGVPPNALVGTVFIGELGLDGRLRPVAGVLPMVMAAARRGFRRVFVPEPQAGEAAMVPGMEVFGVRSLAQVVAQLRGEIVPVAAPVTAPSGSQLLSWRGEDRREDLDMSDLVGMADAKLALQVAAAGGHHIMLSGPKGAGKTSLAERLPTILPDLTREEALELTAVRSLSGPLEPVQDLFTRPPFHAPHHDASKASILGGGSGRVRPGELSRSHCGVLFMDEFPLFRADVIDGLRQPMESGEIRVVRGQEAAVFPARGMVVLAANPCPCGEFHPVAGLNRCDCQEVARRDYRRKVSGPITDRIDILRHVLPARGHDGDRFEVRDSSEQMRERVGMARQRQGERYSGLGWRLNSQAPGHVLSESWPLPEGGQRRLDDALYAGRVSRRGATRVHRLAWSVADLRGRRSPGEDDVDTALRLRSGDPLVLSALEAAR